jgi:hypothetical protein
MTPESINSGAGREGRARNPLGKHVPTATNSAEANPERLVK